MTTITIRHIKAGDGACRVCDKVLGSVARRINGRDQLVARVHGPRNNRCPGGHQSFKPWLEATGLPGWDQMSDLDKGAALLHVWKRDREGAAYARTHYPCRYFTHPALVALPLAMSCRHASVVTGGWDAVADRVGQAEVERLYDLALVADRSRDASDQARDDARTGVAR